MASDNTILYFGPGRAAPSEFIARFAQENTLEVEAVEREDEVRALLNRTFPACVILEGDSNVEEILELSRVLKGDVFTGIVPLIVMLSDRAVTASAEFLEAGVDDVIRADLSERERYLRLQQVLRRADRDVSVHPTTRLPGTNHIARDMQARLVANQQFAVCYADLDHFKEFNDRYGYAFGDGVIRMLSKILRDMVRGLAPGGFVGHIGGDDFICILPLEYLEVTCDEIIDLFDELIPYQYTEEDRRAGYFLGKDRRGNIHRIPLIALSIGVVTNQFQEFEHTGQISELAAEMKTYAKSLPGSKYVVDRRHQSPMLPTASAEDEATLAAPDQRGRPAEMNT
ncbi:MAG: diguanylate cyclase [Gemmatimonadetes bacterium]|nr:diguanylate cyclase [Gemmatimonadota bacterium]MDA1104341.1 diguanylate cyclase [Gemmatimonadota bacterium]